MKTNLSRQNSIGNSLPHFWRLLALFVSILLVFSTQRTSAHLVVPVGEPILDPPTVRSLGVYWILRDTDAQPAHVAVEYRKIRAAIWKQGPPLFRVEKGPFKGEGGKPRPQTLDIPDGAHLFAGSVLLLDPDTAYELRLTLGQVQNNQESDKLEDTKNLADQIKQNKSEDKKVDQNSNKREGKIQKILKAHTLGEPITPASMMQRHVVPGQGGGTGIKADPFRGLQTAEKAAQPGDLFLVHAGVYEVPLIIHKSGEPGHPIVWRGAGDGETILDAHEVPAKLKSHAVDACGVHDVWFEKLSIRNAFSAIRAHESSRIVVRRCHLYNIICGVFAAKDDTDQVGGFFISDNRIEGIMPWPVTDKQWHDLPESRGIWITGRGNVVCYNCIQHCKDGMDLDDCRACVSNDFYNNDIHEMFDDGSEMDGSDRNTRNFNNRYTNVLCGVSFQPIYGGPVYVFRNVIYNIRNEPFKLHNAPSGAIIVHNTTVRAGSPLKLGTPDTFSNCYSRNNLYVGTGGRAYDCSAPARDCDFDYDGFAGWSGDVYFKWNNIRYASPAEVKAKCPIERHLILLDAATLFTGGTQAPDNEMTVFNFESGKLDLHLKAGSSAIHAGEKITGFGDYTPGMAPSLGAYEVGSETPHYGPRPEK